MELAELQVSAWDVQVRALNAELSANKLKHSLSQLVPVGYRQKTGLQAPTLISKPRQKRRPIRAWWRGVLSPKAPNKECSLNLKTSV